MFLDAMHGIASLVVVVYHLPCIHGFKMQYVYLAVELSFTLSGCVMAYSYEECIGNGLPFKNFAFNRLVPVSALSARDFIRFPRHAGKDALWYSV